MKKGEMKYVAMAVGGMVAIGMFWFLPILLVEVTVMLAKITLMFLG